MKSNHRDNLFHKAIFILSILGILNTVHLYIMNERGFDRGCLGFETSQEFEESFDCESVVQEGLKIFGLSNISLGFLFYSLLILCVLASLFVKNDLNRLLIRTRDILILGGFIYSLYLSVYQHFILLEYCALCLISGLISSCLLILLIWSGFLKNTSIPDKGTRNHYLLILAIGVIAAGADSYYFSKLDKIKSQTIKEKLTESLIAEDKEFNPAECTFDDKKKTVSDFKNLVSDYDIQFGSKESDFTIIEIFDPNCTHCKKLHPKMKEIIKNYKDEAFIIIKPNPLWSYSIIQIQAIYIAHENGLLNEMLEKQFLLQSPGKGLNLQQVLEISENIGLDKEMVAGRIKSRHYVNQIMTENKKIKAAGITSAPTLLFNGHSIDGKSRNSDCIAEFIRRELD